LVFHNCIIFNLLFIFDCIYIGFYFNSEDEFWHYKRFGTNSVFNWFDDRLIGKGTLRKYYSYGLKILPEHELVKKGIYKHIRHPIYLAFIIYSIGISLFFLGLYGFITMLGLIPLILYRIKIEENMLLERFGVEYDEYMERSKNPIYLLIKVII